MNNQEQNGPTPDELLAGGAAITVQVVNPGRQAILDERPFVRLIPVREYPKLRECLAEEERLVELYCAKPVGWAVSLTPESHERLVAEGRRLNAHFFDSWLLRRKTLEESLQSRIMGDFLDTAARELAGRMLEMQSASSSAVPPPPPAPVTPSTKSAS